MPESPAYAPFRSQGGSQALAGTEVRNSGEHFTAHPTVIQHSSQSSRIRRTRSRTQETPCSMRERSGITGRSFEKEENEVARGTRSTNEVPGLGDVLELTSGPTGLNASGHKDQLHRQYGLLGICGLALTIDNAWVAFGGSLSVSFLNGGPPGVLYEFIAACVYYALIGASIAELASAVPSSGGVYHWASITPGVKWGRIIGFFAGSLNFFGWNFGLASIVSIPANVVVQMYAVFHPDFVPLPWHSYLAFVLITWLCTAVVVFGNRWIPFLQQVGMFVVLVGGLVTIIVVAVLPKEYASNAFVWRNFDNQTGWSDGIAFLTGILNGAFTIGTPDAVTHLAEELPNPSVDLPKAVFAQVGLGFITTFLYAIAIFYGINDIDAVLANSGSFPLAEVYTQVTGTPAGTFGLLFIILLSVLLSTIRNILMVGRLLWSLARDDLTPFARTLSSVNEKLSCPIPATVLGSILCTGFGAIQLGSKTAFTDLVGSFIILTTMSYFLTICSHLVTGRTNVRPGPFWMGRAGFVVNGIACVLIVLLNVWFCWPYDYPVTVAMMDWNSVIFSGVLAMITLWWFIHGSRNYPGPRVVSFRRGSTQVRAGCDIEGATNPI